MLGNPARAVAVASMALVALVVPASVAARDASPLAGIVRDALGHAIADADVLISDGGVAPVAVLRSDLRGHVFLAELPVGLYRIAALKQGYLTIVQRLDSGAQAWVDMVLEPAMSLEARDLPDDAWALRLPRRYLLHEVEEGPWSAAIEADRSPEIGAAGPLEVQVDHLVALHPGSGARGQSRDVAGTETMVRVASGVGSRAGIEVQGYRRALEASRRSERELTSADRGATGVRVGFSYATEPNSDLAVSAFWGRSDFGSLRTLESIAAPAPPLESAQRSWGYGATWSKPLANESRLDLSMDYRDTSVSRPTQGAGPTATEEKTQLSSRAIAAAGTYLATPSSTHEVQVQFGARVLGSADVLRVASSAAAADAYGLPGLSVGIEARDRWSVGGPLAVIWGLGYRHSIEPVDVAMIVPRVGGAWRIEEFELSAVVSYHGVTDAGADPAAATRTFRGSGDVGYELSATVPLGSSFRLSTGSSYVPSQLGLATCRTQASASGPPMFVSDGDVEVREQRIALSRHAGRFRGTLDVLSGSARGALDTVLPVDAPVYRLAEREARYVGGILGLHAVRSGTRMSFSYRQVAQSAPTTSGGFGEGLRLRAIELALSQDLFSMHTLGTWRALAGIRSAEAVSSTDEDEDDARMLSATGRQVSAGVSVLF